MIETTLKGCYRFRMPVHIDIRGRFVKTFHAPTLSERGLCVRFEEDFFSVSRRHVLRGFHFAMPPRHGAKLVYLIHGRVSDAILDLRRDSASFGRHESFELDAEDGDALLLAAGVAHAFLTLSESATVGYKVEFAFDPSCDGGVHWDSTSLRWPIQNPIVSERDQLLPALADFLNPFS